MNNKKISGRTMWPSSRQVIWELRLQKSTELNMGLTRTHGQINNDGHYIEIQIDTAAQDSGIKMQSEEIENNKGNNN